MSNDAKPGENCFKFIFKSSIKEVKNQSEQFEKWVPCSEGNNQYPFMNLIRKPQYQSGWDFAPCLVSVGLLGQIQSYH
jgi:beta-mannosidase